MLSTWNIFKSLPITAQIYVALFVAILFSGATVVYGYIPEMLLLMLVVLCLMAAKRGPRQSALLTLRGWVPMLLLVAFAVFLLYQQSFAFDSGLAQLYSVRYLIYASLLLFVVRPKVTYCAVKVSKIYAAVCALSILLEVAVSGSKSGGLLGSYQSAGMMMSIGCILWLIDYYRDGGLSNMCGILLCVFALATSGKRTFSIIAMGAFVAMYYFSRRKNGKRSGVAFFGILLALIVLIVALYMFVPSVHALFDRFLLLEEDSFTATSGRNLLWAAAWEAFLDNPLTGIGFGSFEGYYGLYYLGNRGGAYLTHNIYYGLLAETGLFGFILFVVLFAWALVFTWKIWRNTDRVCDRGAPGYLAIFSLAMQLWFIVYGFTGNGIYDANEMFFYIAAVGIALSLKWYPAANSASRVQSRAISPISRGYRKRYKEAKGERIAQG